MLRVGVKKLRFREKYLGYSKKNASSKYKDMIMQHNRNIESSNSFRDLECWQKAHEFVKMVYSITKAFPADEQYGLTSQFRRAAVSIAANICEGYRKVSVADKLRFLNIAQGSLEECRYYIILSFDIGYINRETYEHLDYLISGTSWKLNGYAEALNKKRHQPKSTSE